MYLLAQIKASKFDLNMYKVFAIRIQNKSCPNMPLPGKSSTCIPIVD